MKTFRILKFFCLMELSNVKVHIFIFSKMSGNKLLIPIFVVQAAFYTSVM